MDLFGTKRKRATQAAVDALRPMIAILQHHHGLPARFWTDEFVLGYAASIIGLASRMVVPDLSTTDKGEVLANTLTAVSNQNGVELRRRFVDLSISPTPSFNKGIDNGMTSFLFVTGRLKDPDKNPDVIEARAMAGDHKGMVGTMLLTNLFNQVVIERFDLKH
jgi:hypothetical protein